MPKNLAFLFWAKNGQNLAPSSRKWRNEIQIGENGGERKINPSANPVCSSLEYSMTVKLLTEHLLEVLSLTGGCRGLSESTLVKMPYCWKSHVTAHNIGLFVFQSRHFQQQEIKEERICKTQVILFNFRFRSRSQTTIFQLC